MCFLTDLLLLILNGKKSLGTSLLVNVHIEI